MTATEFETQFARLTSHFHLPTDASRDTLGVDWLQALQGYDVATFERAVTTLTRTAQDRFWPPLGRVIDLCRARAAGTDKQGKCATCHGATWIDSAPFLSNGMIYENTCIRCPDCGVPPPVYTPPNRKGLTAAEYREWSQGDSKSDYMPDACKAKPRSEVSNTEIKAAMDTLRKKLFGDR